MLVDVSSKRRFIAVAYVGEKIFNLKDRTKKRCFFSALEIAQQPYTIAPSTHTSMERSRDVVQLSSNIHQQTSNDWEVIDVKVIFLNLTLYR